MASDYITATKTPVFELRDRVRVKGTDITYVITEIPEPNMYNSSSTADALVFSFYGSELEKI